MMTTTTQIQIPPGEIVSASADETFNYGRQLGNQLRGGEVLLLSGPLGAGKTIFVKGLAAALNIDPQEVTSPTFTLVNPYAGSLTLYHIDLYRLNDGPAAAHAVDLEDLLSDERAVIVIEWAERLGPYPLPADVLRVTILGEGEDPRRFTITRSCYNH
ncbi:MAG: tRNA threonylcarbamoyladenosine biosynthesis protein TsaE [Blastocatellia bacterium]|jgi:tRNA threonylcarbamoyladenosine biosynthesis protein TsaE|nr:tRNA threonylcarbamoyladenosine biosynthesis protein TsaE [Blastocatellia bacterium]